MHRGGTGWRGGMCPPEIALAGQGVGCAGQCPPPRSASHSSGFAGGTSVDDWMLVPPRRTRRNQLPMNCPFTEAIHTSESCTQCTLIPPSLEALVLCFFFLSMHSEQYACFSG